MQPVRLVGVTLNNLQDFKDEPQMQLSLFDDIEPEKEVSRQKSEALENTIFDLHNKYGRGILKTAKELEVWNKIGNKESE